MVTPEEARKLATYTEDDYCSCLPAYKDRGMVDPQCQSCQTRDERHECAKALRDLASQVESLQADAERDKVDAECFRVWVHEAWNSPGDICRLLMNCETPEDYRAKLVPIILEKNAAIDEARKQS